MNVATLPLTLLVFLLGTLPAGLARVEVKFVIDANGILEVHARDLHTNESRRVEVQPSYGLSDAEVERMLEESIDFAEQDFAQRQLIEARNEGNYHATAEIYK